MSEMFPGVPRKTKPRSRSKTKQGFRPEQATIIDPPKRQQVPANRPSPKPAERPPIGERAGTVLDHRFTVPIYGKAKTGTTQHGVYDERQRTYQGGGELSDFVYWKERWVTLSIDVWDQVVATAEWIELIDHETNRCYRASIGTWVQNAHRYDAGIGPRIGIPMDLCDVSSPPAPDVDPLFEKPDREPAGPLAKLGNSEWKPPPDFDADRKARAERQAGR